MDNCLQSVLPQISKVLNKPVVGECCVTNRPEEYLNTRAELAYSFTNYNLQIRHILQSIGYSSMAEKYSYSVNVILSLLHAEPEYFKVDRYENIYILFDHYCPIRLKCSDCTTKQNLVIYIVMSPDDTWWSTIKEWSGLNTVNKWFGYNKYLPCDQY